ncbi:MAG: ribonucleoside-diphosphate reductase subunit alpha [Bdellovibrio sp.]|nr:ribonucleoside-diphosphate reductase subunit alpha [Bdellovibrio sp.]
MEIQARTNSQANHSNSTIGANSGHVMRVKKRDGSLEPVDVTKIVERVNRCCQGLMSVDPLRVATKAISGLYDGASTKELDNLCIQTASLLIGEDPEYSRLAARLLSTYIDEEVRTQKVGSFADSIQVGFNHGLLSAEVHAFVMTHKTELCAAIEHYKTDRFEYFGLRTVYDRYLLKNPKSRQVFETPQYFFMRVACGLAQSPAEAIELYKLTSSHDYMPSTPTLFNSGTQRPQMSSCYLLDSPQDDLRSIYNRYTDIALLSKFAGGIGLAYSRIRSRGSLIKGTNGHSNGIIPWLKTLDSSVSAVNQGGKRKGAACVYLETWHADIEEFLELRDNTGDDAKRTHNINIANWVPDLFMNRVEADAMWSLFDPSLVPHFVDLYGKEFEAAYLEAEGQKLFHKQIKARDLYSRMMKTLAQTGNGWMTFKDASNVKANQTGEPGNVIHLSNLCTEILEVTSKDETAVCNLGSVNLGRHITADGKLDFDKLATTVKVAVKYLDRVIDINFYPIDTALSSNNRWRPIGLGIMGLQDAFFQLKYAFDSAEAEALSTKIQEEIYYNALTTSIELAEKHGAHTSFEQTKAAKGLFQFDLWNVKPADMTRWDALRTRMMKSGLRNSLMIAIAPTATIASLVGAYEATEPQISNLFKRETLSGEFMQVNKYLVQELKNAGLWNEEMRNEIKMSEGSIQHLESIPEDIRKLYKTVWEVPMKALVDMAAARGAYIDQSQSLNLFQENSTIGKLSSMYMYAWKKGIKTTYYLRSRPATSIAKTTVRRSATAHPNAAQTTTTMMMESTTTTVSAVEVKKEYTDSEIIACSLENPEACEACQ